MVLAVGGTTTTKIAIGTTAVREPLTSPGSLRQQARVMCKTTDAVIKFGDSTVTADNTYTDDQLAVGNFVVLAGAVESFTIPSDATHVSVICEDGTSTGGFVWVQPCTGE